MTGKPPGEALDGYCPSRHVELQKDLSLFASPVRRQVVRVIARSFTPIDVDRSRTRAFFSFTNLASLRSASEIRQNRRR